MSIQTTKRCLACKTEKPVAQFNRQGNGKGQYQARCKPCQSIYLKEWRISRDLAITATHKVCRMCKVELPRAAFYMQKDARRGTLYPSANCKECERIRCSKGLRSLKSMTIPPPPCDDCKMFQYCRVNPFECRAFREYTQFGKWSSEYPRREVAA